MSMTLDDIQDLAPDQASLNAAKKLLSPRKWPLRARKEALIWGDCQGSGANPYHIVFDLDNHGYKCNCPSRKFPCKHVLALAWQFVEDENGFQADEVPAWISEWQMRRRGKTDAEAKKQKKEKDIHAVIEKNAPPADPEKAATAAKRAAQTREKTDATVSAGIEELQQWLNDQLRLGLVNFLDNPEQRCRQIAARLVDAKAATLASRLDELPAKIESLTNTDLQLRQVINELGKIAWLVKAWQKNSADPDTRRAVISAENRAQLLENPAAQRQTGIWQVVGERTFIRRDNLISYTTWLILRHDADGGRCNGKFAVLQDYYPLVASSQELRRSTLGKFYEAEMVFYPSRFPLRAVMDEQIIPSPSDLPPLQALSTRRDFFVNYQQALGKIPWLEELPYLLPAGRIIRQQENSEDAWWQSAGENPWHLPLLSLPVAPKNSFDLLTVSELKNIMVLWDGLQATFCSAESEHWGLLTAKN